MALRRYDSSKDASYRMIWPPRLIWVFEGGDWAKGQLEGLKQTTQGTFALVRLNPRPHALPGQAHWVPARHTRPREAS